MLLFSLAQAEREGLEGEGAMNRYEEFEASVLRVAPAEIVPNRSFSLSTTAEGAKRQIPEPLVREVLL
jgi:hypothetical protein